jgi:prevent-host-death family protein
MKKASITETKNQLSALVDRVKRGETVLILDRGHPVARMEPVSGDVLADPEGRIDRLERAGIVRRASLPPPDDLLSTSPPRARHGASISQALLEDRRGGR